MAYKTGFWGEQAKKRSAKRKSYFRGYSYLKRFKLRYKLTILKEEVMQNVKD
jgi:hypothetical protein